MYYIDKLVAVDAIYHYEIYDDSSKCFVNIIFNDTCVHISQHGL